ncbi:retrovirus-related Pol polyprotein from transposon 412 [Trichonephila clavipes]|uniref:Retrovirus-related Pol polyprotein from transposon 412 n=1 Tax=Trichonephila clavipes TaxID=2585209 RepID=A0A8X7B8L1_TRICX|nr:retrovirus-related Pol polyprotein from transposon 412 [Trichonephila clavipes]
MNFKLLRTAYIAHITDPCILGLDFLKNNNFKLDFENSNMHSKFEDITLFGLQTQFESNQKIIAKTNFSLSPRTECILHGRVAENRTFPFGVIDYPDSGSLKAGVLIASSVVDLSNSVIPVRIANISDRTRTIQEGEVIEASAPVTCVDRKCNTQNLSSEDLVKDLQQNTDLDEKQRWAAGGLINSSAYFQEHLRTLEEYDVEIHHRKGSAHGNVDAFSRRPCHESCKYCSRIENKFGVIDPIVREASHGPIPIPLGYHGHEAPFERTALDILGPLPRSSDGNNNILVVVDYFTKWPVAYPIPDQEASIVAELLVQHWILRFGVPLQTALRSREKLRFCSLQESV